MIAETFGNSKNVTSAMLDIQDHHTGAALFRRGFDQSECENAAQRRGWTEEADYQGAQAYLAAMAGDSDVDWAAVDGVIS